MKAIILKKKGSSSIALTDDGQIIKVKTKKELSTGHEFEYSKPRNDLKRVLATALTSILILTFAFGAYAYATPAAYITLDINPSDEITINSLGYVIGARALNEDGEEILDKSKLLNRRFKTALNILIDNAENEGYIMPEDEEQILLTILSYSNTLKEKFSDELDETKQEVEEDRPGIGIIISASNILRKKEAEALGISPGKLLLIQKIEVDEGVELDPADYIDMSVKDIVAMGKQVKEKVKNEKALENMNKPKESDDSQEESEIENTDPDNENENENDKEKDKSNNGKGN